MENMSSFNPWPYQRSPALAQQLEAFGRLELPRDNYTSSLTPIGRYVEDDVPTGAIVAHDTRSLHPPPSLLQQGCIAYSNPGSDYQRSLQDQVDTDSSCSESNNLHYTAFEGSTESSSGSLGEDDYHHQQSSASTSPDYHGSGFEKTWAQEHPYMTQASDLHASVDPNLAHNGFVCLKEVVHISPCGDDRSQEGHNDSMEDDDESGLGYPQTVPVLFQPPCYDRCYPDQPPPPMGVFPHQHDPSLGHGHSCPSAQGSRQSSPARALKLKTMKSRRVKGCPEMMKPFSEVSGEGEKARKVRGEKTRGRGAGKKPKERKVCREHPGKVFAHASDYKKHMNQQHLRPFLCVFYFSGCIQTFGSKNEWKRHVYSQHLQISYWACDDSTCADRKAIFNRKDLFGQHIKRMHPPPAGPKTSTSAYTDEMIERCRVERRKPPQNSRCGYCKQTFSGPQSWEQRMEHVGQHYEKNNYKGISRDRWVPDEGLIAWSLEHGIIEDNGAGGYTIVSTGKDAIVKAGVEHKKLAKEEEMARVLTYPDDCDVDYDDDRDAEGDEDYC